jgi:L-cysteine:1D-myo-inositol 2-amino-2-deoxy-alpha-D-glucopyranoside ligase
MILYDTRKKGYLPFKPSKTVKIYVCGITPYDSAHLGHIFTFMTYDLLQRRLEEQDHEVQMVRNVTDVDEPIYAKAKELGIPYMQLADREVDSFHKILDKLNFRPLFSEPRASQYIDAMINAVKRLQDKGFAYFVDKDLYYDTAKDPAFGDFSGLSKKLLMGFMANRGGDPERPGKRNPLDFLLWKSIAEVDDPAQWESPFGPGRPGWHIECSVMSGTLLGIPFDLHGGGTDLIFPHHECEIAQSFGLGDNEVAEHWVHVSPMLLYGEKMSKSLGNLVFAKDLLENFDAATIRLALMHYSYRVGGEWQPEYLDKSKQLLTDFKLAAKNINLDEAIKFQEAVRSRLDDDLNMPKVVHEMEKLVWRNTERRAVKESEDIKASEVINSTLDLIGLSGSV